VVKLKSNNYLKAVKNLFYAYKLYAQNRRIFGHNCTICSTAPIGTGDYYFIGMYIRNWLLKNSINNWIMLCENKNVKNVTRLFKIFDDHTYIPQSTNTIHNMYKILAFCKISNYYYFHYAHSALGHAGIFMMYPKASHLFGYRGLEMLDLYLYGALLLSRNTTSESPVFEYDGEMMNDILEYIDYDLENVILISPYSASYREHMPPLSFWINIVNVLKCRGFKVFTNCAGREKAIIGTKKLMLPYEISIPLLNKIAGFIGIRSGLCDIICTAKCKKIILHPYGSRNWSFGKSIAFTGLNNMKLCNDAIEMEFESCWTNIDLISKQLLENFVK